MSKELFEKYVDENRDCDIKLLDYAVQKGIRKAQDNRLDPRKFVNLAAALAIAFVTIITITATPIQTAAGNYFVNRNHPLQDSAEILDAGARQFMNNLLEFLGDD